MFYPSFQLILNFPFYNLHKVYLTRSLTSDKIILKPKVNFRSSVFENFILEEGNVYYKDRCQRCLIFPYLLCVTMIRKVCFRISSAFQEYASLMKKEIEAIRVIECLQEIRHGDQRHKSSLWNGVLKGKNLL